MRNSSIANTYFRGVFFYCVKTVLGLYFDRSPSVFALVGLWNPFTVFGAVVTVIIDPFNRMDFRRPLAHVC
jgi:hypothetical protein